MTNGPAELNPVQRFERLFNTVEPEPQPFVVAEEKAGAPHDISLTTARNVGPRNLRRLGYRAITMLTQVILTHPDFEHIGTKKELMELFKAPDGTLTPYFGDIIAVASGGIRLNSPYTQPYRRLPITVDSALLAMEQAIGIAVTD